MLCCLFILFRIFYHHDKVKQTHKDASRLKILRTNSTNTEKPKCKPTTVKINVTGFTIRKDNFCCLPILKGITFYLITK